MTYPTRRRLALAFALTALALAGLLATRAGGKQSGGGPAVMRDVGVDSDGFIIQSSDPSGVVVEP